MSQGSTASSQVGEAVGNVLAALLGSGPQAPGRDAPAGRHVVTALEVVDASPPAVRLVRIHRGTQSVTD